MSEQIKRVNRELKFKGTIIDFYQDTMEINGLLSSDDDETAAGV